MLTNTLLPGGSYEREPLVAQPGMFKKIENAMETGANNHTPTWLSFLAIWLQVMTGKHLKYILRDSFLLERGAKWILFFCKRSATRYSQPDFYWGAPSQTSSGFNWTKPFLE